MNERPGFRRKADRRLLAIALLTPWLLGGLAYSVPLLNLALHRGGYELEWLAPSVMMWFYTFNIAAVMSLPAWALFGVWRLVWRREYRRSWYGWLWLLLMYLNLVGIVLVIGH